MLDNKNSKIKNSIEKWHAFINEAQKDPTALHAEFDDSDEEEYEEDIMGFPGVGEFPIPAPDEEKFVGPEQGESPIEDEDSRLGGFQSPPGESDLEQHFTKAVEDHEADLDYNERASLQRAMKDTAEYEPTSTVTVVDAQRSALGLKPAPGTQRQIRGVRFLDPKYAFAGPEMVDALGRAGEAVGGIIVGDIGKKGGGPLDTAHRSHRLGRDADVAVFRLSGGTTANEPPEDMAKLRAEMDNLKQQKGLTRQEKARLRAIKGTIDKYKNAKFEDIPITGKYKPKKAGQIDIDGKKSWEFLRALTKRDKYGNQTIEYVFLDDKYKWEIVKYAAEEYREKRKALEFLGRGSQGELNDFAEAYTEIFGPRIGHPKDFFTDEDQLRPTFQGRDWGWVIGKNSKRPDLQGLLRPATGFRKFRTAQKAAAYTALHGLKYRRYTKKHAAKVGAKAGDKIPGTGKPYNKKDNIPNTRHVMSHADHFHIRTKGKFGSEAPKKGRHTMVRGKKMKRDPTLKEIVSAVVDRLLFEEDKTKDPKDASAEAKDVKDVEYEAEETD